MPTFTVYVTRTERIAFEVDAADAQEAEGQFLASGDEVGSETVSLVVDSVKPGTIND